MAKIRWVDREILTNEDKVTFSAPLRCPYFEAFFHNNIILNQYIILMSNYRSALGLFGSVFFLESDTNSLN